MVPDYAGGCVTNVVPALLGWGAADGWLPACVRTARQVVLLVLDGLGWDQLRARPQHAPTLTGMDGGAITTVAPSTTAAALTSITTGMTPGAHGIIGYRIDVDGQVLNVLRWNAAETDARRTIPPTDLQPAPAFGNKPVLAITKAEFVRTGFTAAHLTGARFCGYRMASSLVAEVDIALRSGESFVYAYYEGIDKVGHEYGLGEHYDRELAAADRLVAELTDALPPGAALVVTADHGMIETGDDLVTPHPDVLALSSHQSGEGRFRWFHAADPAAAGDLLAAACSHHSHHAWVRSVDQAIDDGWFGPEVTREARAHLGDVALAAQGTVAFVDPADSGPFNLIGRHGSLTSAEMLVPLLAVSRTS